MKSLLIVVLLIVLCVGAYWSKPTQSDFTVYYQQLHGQQTGMSLKGVVGQLETDSYLHSIIFHDRLLWVTVEKDGQRQYIGAFNHWFKSAAATTPAISN